MSEDQITFLPWTEKYRVRDIDQIKSQPFIANLKNKLQSEGSDGISHFIFHGSAGTGKSSTAGAICTMLFGPKIVKERVKEFNASEDRGINAIRDKIKFFASLKIGRRDPDYPCPDLKIIVLDEADCLTQDAQAALRSIIETSRSTRFLFLCNDVNMLSDAIKSRCFSYRFNRIKESDVISKLSTICHQENVRADIDVITHIATYSDGDMRKAIHMLQGCCWDGLLHMTTIQHMTGVMTDVQKTRLLEKVKHGDAQEMCIELERLFAFGIDPHAMIDQLVNYVIDNPHTDQANILLDMMKSSQAIRAGSDQVLHLWSICSRLAI